ncbi:YafY family transcriptional regulator [Neorhizobium galegae]|uniref:Helix-turn-helix type 11 domain protein n=2 Tax=Neorhizobium galegae bv. officinalis TaxID=323656 RepID=A0A0T7G0B0_NEOGA|nr:YafY family protein [Neorhizobium galegae]KAA9382284.1 YafY family transcriptional regulator [Neorhizobium galegae]KAB1108557.1 YafY family transcriptional regulator [Neorhizobium galegae]MCQ1769568.1 YafY family transcriptional regulator [Neorhizobium galegae]MCQ1775279.1 YafY family transcriptional regulator [Neorhizobium galegae]MCQ1781300.1 YafY family transcriptional regulator [Neorhizobium galegae]
MRRADRLLQIIQILRRERRPISGRTIASELEVSLRTIYRDMAALEASGVPVFGEPSVGYVLQDGYDLPPLMFSTNELEIVMLGLRMVGARGGKEINTTARDVVAKISAILPDAKRSEFWTAPLLAPGPEVLPKDGPVLLQLRGAMKVNCKVEILYHTADREPERRTVWPIVIAFFDCVRVLAAWCELREAYRYFRTDRMLEVNLLPVKVPRSRKRIYADWWHHEKMESKLGVDGMGVVAHS